MPARRILQLGNPLLRAPSVMVERLGEAAPVVRDLRDTLHEFRRAHGFGRGISAVQIGELKRIIYLEAEGAAHTLINPRFEMRSEEKFKLWDDCFSFPDLLVYVERSVSVRVRYQDEQGEWKVLEGAGPLSELLQHEMDHLDGVLAVDRAIDKFSLCTRFEYERRFSDSGQEADRGPEEEEEIR